MSVAAALLVIGLIKGTIVLSALSVADVGTLAAAGVSVTQLAVLANKQLDQRFPCNRECQLYVARTEHCIRHPMNGAMVVCWKEKYD